MYCYAILPIDLAWGYLQSVASFRSDIVYYQAFGADPLCANVFPLDQFDVDWAEAQENAKQQGWEGDFSEGPQVFMLPSEGQFVYAFVFKQGNNGNTYVVSPIELPWLNGLEY